MTTFALIGLGGFIAPRHLKGIRHVGGNLLVAHDPNDSVGIMDSHFPDAHFYTHFEHFDQHVAELREQGKSIDYVSICSPNYMHDSHISWAMRSGANAICEKPLVLDVAQIDKLKKLEERTDRKVSTILQLRLHPAIIKLRDDIARSNKRHSVDLTYITSRGRWYFESWKGDIAKSGGVAANIGIHFFDMLGFLFGPLEKQEAHYCDAARAAGYLSYRNADVRWFLSVDRNDLPPQAAGKTTFRAVEIDGQDAEFSEGFTDLHDASYREIMAGKGFTLDEVRPCIETVNQFRSLPFTSGGERHPFVARYAGT
jgi:UDP-N-acetyl-2-amino-2-deoxyglucuronate dehydrogenase